MAYVFSGKVGLITIPDAWAKVEALLYLESVGLRPGALARLTPHDLVDALKNPLDEVREGVLLSLGQP